jgi:hypothetical protein
MEMRTPQMIQGAADSLVCGQALRIADPFVVVEIIDELNAQRIEALQECDCRTGKKLKDTSDSARLQFRQRERDVLHREVLARLDERAKDAAAAAAAAKDHWKHERLELAQSQRTALLDLTARQEDEHRQLEAEWVQPEALRQFDKRSAGLLQNRQIEQYLVLCGNLTGADQMKRINAQTEKVELRQREQEMGTHFAIARENLRRKHDRDADKLRMEQESDMKIQGENERKDLLAKSKRLEITQRMLVEEKDDQKFMTKKFHRSAEIVVPATVLRCKERGEDLPAIAHGKAVPPGVAPMLEVRKKIVVTRLPLAPLPIKHFRPPPLFRPPKPKKADV